jgi:hypothetical protein
VTSDYSDSHGGTQAGRSEPGPESVAAAAALSGLRLVPPSQLTQYRDSESLRLLVAAAAPGLSRSPVTVNLNTVTHHERHPPAGYRRPPPGPRGGGHGHGDRHAAGVTVRSDRHGPGTVTVTGVTVPVTDSRTVKVTVTA